MMSFKSSLSQVTLFKRVFFFQMSEVPLKTSVVVQSGMNSRQELPFLENTHLRT